MKNFILGERKEIRIRVISQINPDEKFTIRSATYELNKIQVTGIGELEIEGVPTIIDHDIYVIVEPQKVGNYRLIFSYWIADEKLKTVVEIMVK